MVVRRGMAGFVNAAVNAASHVLDEGAEDSAVQRGYYEIPIDDYARGCHAACSIRVKNKVDKIRSPHSK
jgi:hypothetical protein